MTTTSTEDPALGAALANLWQRHRQTNLDRISLLEATAANALRAVIDDSAIEEGVGAAHKLAGSLGSFGFDAGSRAAFEAEALLREPVINGRLLAEAVVALRCAVEENEESTGIRYEQPVYDQESKSESAIRIVSLDADLISRLTVEAAGAGLAVSSAAEMPSQDSLSSGMVELVVLDHDAFASWASSDLLNSLAEIARKMPVVVLTTHEEFNHRVAFAAAGVVGVFPRSQGSRQTISFVSEELTRRRSAPFTVLATNADSRLIKTLNSALAGPQFRLHIRNGPSNLWEALEAQGADLVVIGFDGTELEGPELCRVIRSHPRWHRLPVIIVGTSNPGRLDSALTAGADDYLSSMASSIDFCARLHTHLDRGRIAQARSDLDPLTGAANRTAAERSMDALLRLARRKNEPFALALIAVDQVNEIQDAEGSAVLDVVLRPTRRQVGAKLSWRRHSRTMES